MSISCKNGKTGYYGYVYYYTNDGKRHCKSAGSFKLKREAKKAALDLEQRLKAENPQLSQLTFVDYFNRWIKLYKSGKVGEHGLYQYRLNGKWIEKYFKKTKMADIKPSEFQEFLAWYGKNHSYESVRKLKSACANCVSRAVDDDILHKNFTNHSETIYNRQRTRRVEYLTSNELAKLVTHTVDALDTNYTSRYMILTAIYTGMRKSEIQALTWKDIDFKRSSISVSKAWDEKKKAFKPTKTESSNRVIKVNRSLLNHLTNLKANNSTMVFCNQFGTIPTSNALNKCLRSIMKAAGIEKQGFHFHSLRHVHVAYLIGQGVDIYAISKRLGHANVNITLGVYSYLIDEYKAKNDSLIINKLENLEKLSQA